MFPSRNLKQDSSGLLAPVKAHGVFTLFFLLMGFYAVAIGLVDDNRIRLVGMVAPIFGAILFTQYARRILLILLVTSLVFAARFRLTGLDFHTGGAEAAIAPVDFAIAGLLFWMVMQAVREGKGPDLPITPVTLALPLLIIVHLPSLIVAANTWLALLEILRLIKMALLLLVIIHYIKTRRDLVFVIMLILFSIGIQGLLAFLQGQFGFSSGLGFLGERDDVWVVQGGSFVGSRAGGTMGHANALAHFMEMTLPLALAIILSRLPNQMRTVATIVFGVGLLGLYMTLSRGGWGAALFGFAIVFLGNPQWRKKRERSRMVVYTLLAGLAALIVGALLLPTVIARISQFTEVSWLFRLRTYDVAVQMVLDNPLFGVGANNYLQGSAPYSEGVLLAWPDAIVHNVYLLVLSETGIVGLIGFLLFLLATWRLARRIIRDPDHLKSTIALGVWGGICALLIHSMLGWLFRYDPVFTLFWFYIGLLVALWRVPSSAGPVT